MSLMPAQSRAARGWLNWTQADLAQRASVGLSTLKDFESGKRTPIANNVSALRRALEEGGASAFLVATDSIAPDAGTDAGATGPDA
ncbi:MAG: helix-turn-helix transcriptional regulator [Alphaproteobacteria bacterium]